MIFLAPHVGCRNVDFVAQMATFYVVSATFMLATWRNFVSARVSKTIGHVGKSCQQFRDFFELKHLDWFELVDCYWYKLFFWSLLLKPGSPYSSGAYSWSPAALNALLSPVCPLLTCLQVELLRMRTRQRPDLNGPPPKIFSRSFTKTFLKRRPMTSPTEGRHSHVPPATPEAQAKPFS